MERSAATMRSSVKSPARTTGASLGRALAPLGFIDRQTGRLQVRRIESDFDLGVEVMRVDRVLQRLACRRGLEVKENSTAKPLLLSHRGQGDQVFPRNRLVAMIVVKHVHGQRLGLPTLASDIVKPEQYVRESLIVGFLLICYRAAGSLDTRSKTQCLHLFDHV